MGGMNIAVSGKRGRQLAHCPHTETLTTITAGVERSVCESCGHLSFHFPEMISGPVHRNRFARPADQVHASKPVVRPTDDWMLRYTPIIGASHADEQAADAQVFATQERFHIRSRYELHPEATAAVA